MQTFLASLRMAHTKVPSDSVTHKLRSIDTAEVPDELWDRVPEMHLLGTASESVLGSIYQLQVARGHLRSSASIWTDEIPPYSQHLEAAVNLAETAVLQLNVLLE